MIAISDILTTLSGDERMAVWMLRYFVGPGRPVCRLGSGALADSCFRKDLDSLGSAFRNALDRLSGLGMTPLDVRMRGCREVSSTEHQLLEATAAAQKGDESAVRSALRPVFSHHHVLAPFAAAVTQLGACLAASGYWLRRSGESVEAERPPMAVTHFEAFREQWDAAVASPAGAHEEAPVAAASLGTLARWRNQDMGLTQVLWPHREPQPGGVPA
ncbi:hypothetical protein [Acetobacter oeni]|uniref:Uncharacterized protein n=1 Tax=Acetobacter oeni TaxID=304077 RepID=A0A511XMA3_9PROT|nr:hypothetical protein [Acetobacter oeni]MBB3884084.1 hypothetical protein [Acetobacter oeni]NHO20089.1 hypothetical protein [Acetobacter oeni]GBR02521.1 hypothetical protein AA21952_0778 [Acetobacter oeni LMG 21952]GEN64069.1 hypothetical protein AOE01nite_22930 [Acetobacter oeni]